MTTSVPAADPSLPERAFKAWVGMVKHMLPATMFFMAGFNLIVWTVNLALTEHGIDLEGFAAATVAALLVGKAVLVTDKLPFMARFDGAPLIQPILFKTVVYWVCVLLVRLLEIAAHFVVDHGSLQGLLAYVVENFGWRRFIAIQVWLMVLFLLYVTVHELGILFGQGELRRLFFRWHSSEAKLARRGRIRLLARLNRLTENHAIEEIGERGSPAHAELVAILQKLASPLDGAKLRATMP